MAEPIEVEPVLLVVAVLWSDAAARDRALELLTEVRFGGIAVAGPDHPFDTDEYQQEMGPELQRRLVAFETLITPEVLVEAKLLANDVEYQLSIDRRRTVNLDAGYLDRDKVVLASVKPAGHKIYLAQGVYADLTLRYQQGRYEPLEWTFADWRDGRYTPELAEMRRWYLDHRRAQTGRN